MKSQNKQFTQSEYPNRVLSTDLSVEVIAIDKNGFLNIAQYDYYHKCWYFNEDDGNFDSYGYFNWIYKADYLTSPKNEE